MFVEKDESEMFVRRRHAAMFFSLPSNLFFLSAVQHHPQHHGQYLFNSKGASIPKCQLEPRTW